MRILLTGCQGQVGWEICRKAPALGFDLVPTSRESLDISQKDQIQTLLAEKKFDLIINAAAYTAVDKAEEEEEKAHQVNAVGPANLAECAAEQNIPILHISTDYVFDGSADSPYPEDAKTNPQGIYGSTKLAGEELLAKANKQHVILRTSWVFGIEGNNFVKTMLRLGADRESLSVVADQIGEPTFAGSIASALLGIAQQIKDGNDIHWGIYHFADVGMTSWHGFATDILQAGYDKGLIPKLPTIQPIPSEDYPTPAKRPAYSVLDCSKFSTSFPNTPLRPWKEGLNELISSLEK